MTDSPALLKRLLVLPAVAGLLITPIATGAQAPNPDLLGISVGMPSNVARTTLQKRMPQSMLQNDTQSAGFTLSVTDACSLPLTRASPRATATCS